MLNICDGFAIEYDFILNAQSIIKKLNFNSTAYTSEE